MGFEPTTYRLRSDCSTVELPRQGFRPLRGRLPVPFRQSGNHAYRQGPCSVRKGDLFKINEIEALRRKLPHWEDGLAFPREKTTTLNLAREGAMLS